MKNNIIARGAEAVITLSGSVIKKNRIEKSYRYPVLDEKLRKERTRKEAKILEKAHSIIPVPKILSSSDKTKEIQMEYIDGKKLSENLEKLKYQAVCKEIGKNLAKLHDAGLIHGDLTTSNMIFAKSKVYFIDFGLGFHSERIEDKAVDLHLIKEALEAKHPTISVESFKAVLEGYKISKNHAKTLRQLEKVEKRGRYKDQY